LSKFSDEMNAMPGAPLRLPQALSENIRVEGTHNETTLAYHTTDLITTVKKFMEQPERLLNPSGLIDWCLCNVFSTFFGAVFNLEGSKTVPLRNSPKKMLVIALDSVLQKPSRN